MITLVYGGAASGKSEYAEAVMARLDMPRLYVATMQPFGQEALQRIERHIIRRHDGGFETAECYGSLAGLVVPAGSAVLLECLGNLAANLLYEPVARGVGEQVYHVRPDNRTVNDIEASIDHVCDAARDAVIVGNDVFASGECYADETMAYLDVLGTAMIHAAARADFVVEVVCGIPVYRKGARQQLLDAVGRGR